MLSSLKCTRQILQLTGGSNEENAKPHAHNVLPTSGEKRRETGLEKLFEVSTFDTLFCDIYLGRAELFM